MTLLSVVRNSCDRIGVQRPSTAFNSTDGQILQIVSLAQQEGRELSTRHDWQVLTKEKTFTTTAAETQTGAVPSDFDRFVNDSFFNRTEKHRVIGPLSPQEWQFHKSVVATTLVEAFRQRGNSILITPAPPASQTMAYEYISTNWCQSSGAVEQSAWAADTDTGILPEELMTLGVIWRWQRAKGLDYSEAFRTYEMQVAQAAARDGGKPTLNMGVRKNRGPGIFVPDGNWYQ